MRAMRTKQQLVDDLAGMNVQAVARESGVCAKTLYRIRTSAEYTPSMSTAEKVSAAIDRLRKRRTKAVA